MKELQASYKELTYIKSCELREPFWRTNVTLTAATTLNLTAVATPWRRCTPLSSSNRRHWRACSPRAHVAYARACQQRASPSCRTRACSRVASQRRRTMPLAPDAFCSQETPNCFFLLKRFCAVASGDFPLCSSSSWCTWRHSSHPRSQWTGFH